MENGPPINPALIEEESAATIQDGRSEEDESYNKEDNKVANKDEPQSSIEQRQSASSASDISLDNRSTTPSSRQSLSSAGPSLYRTPSLTPARKSSLAIRKRATK